MPEHERAALGSLLDEAALSVPVAAYVTSDNRSPHPKTLRNFSRRWSEFRHAARSRSRNRDWRRGGLLLMEGGAEPTEAVR